MLDTDAVLDLVKEVAEKVVTPRFRVPRAGEVDEKGPGDLVTVADRESERLLTRFLRDAYPDAVVLGEEAYAARPELLEEFQAAEHAFTVDPVDGTKNFVKGSPDHAVMVAEVRDGESVRAWIWQPQHELRVRRRARRRRLVQRRAADPARTRRRPGRLARGHLTLARGWAARSATCGRSS